MNTLRISVLWICCLTVLGGAIVLMNSFVSDVQADAPVRDVTVVNLPAEPVPITDVHRSISQVLFEFPTNVGAGETISSPVIDLDGFQTASVNVVITSADATVEREIFFGPFPNNGFRSVDTDAFSPDNGLMTVVPVQGRQMFVTITNNGNFTQAAQGFVYAAR